MKQFSYVLLASVMAAGLPTAMRAQADSGPAIDPEAMQALNKMGAYLRTLKTFQVKADVTQEDVLIDGEKVQYSKVSTVLAHLPDRLFVQETGDRMERFWFYNGKIFTLYAKRAGFYATVNAPPTVDELATISSEKYGVEVPLVDLFYWGGPKIDVSNITSATDIGPSEVAGITCEHYTFRQAGLDWQIWIQLGDFPLPRKFVLTTLTDEARPQHTSVLHWNTTPSFNDATFTFDPPEGVQRIVFGEAKAESGGGK